MRYLPALLLSAFMPTMSISGEFDQPQEAAGKLLTEIAKMDGQIFKAKGVLKRSFFSDNDDPRYVMQVGNRKYSIKLDDGRGTSQKAKNCEKEEFIGMNPNKGCLVTFEAEYNIDLNDGDVDIGLTVWNVEFQ